MSKQYKIQVSGELANHILDSMPETKWLNELRLSPLTFVVEVAGSAERRNECIYMGHTPDSRDEIAYLIDVMTLEDGTFPDLYARDVTREGWTI